MLKKLLDKKINPLFATVVTFMLIFFVFNDFAIRYIYAYFVLGLILLAGIFTSGALRRDGKFSVATIFGDLKDRISPIKAAFIVMVLVVTVYSVLPNSNWGQLVMALTISMLVFTGYLVFMEPSEVGVRRAFTAIRLVAVAFAVYVIAVKLWPDFYWNYVYPHMSPLTQEVADEFMPQGYGVPLGGSTTYADYVISVALTVNLAQIFIGGGIKNNKQILLLVPTTVLYILAILLVNRRSEVLAIGAAGLVLVLLHLKARDKADRILRFKTIIPIIILGSIVFGLFARAGYMNRYTDVLEAIFPNLDFSVSAPAETTKPAPTEAPETTEAEVTEPTEQETEATEAEPTEPKPTASELTSGRTALWKKAYELFKENPVFGIGWEQFMNNNTYEHEVHNTYLQWLCETGVIGFILIMIPLLYMYLTTLFRTVRIRRKGGTLPYGLKEMNFVSLGMQSFFWALNLIDPSFYHQNFFCFFSFTIILEDASRRMEKQFLLGSDS